MINWPDLLLPPINLYSAPYYERNRCKGICDRKGKYCKHCGRFNYDFDNTLGDINEKKAK